MKIAILGDTHLGAREGKEYFHRHFQNFYENVFFPVLKQHNITEVIQLGDLFDRRKFIDFYSLKRAKEYFFNPAREAGIHIHALLGNHDIALRNSTAINSPSLLLTEYDNFTPIVKPTEISFPGCSFLLVPWICSENSKEIFEAIKTTTSEVICGHFEISGFQMYKGLESHEGLEPDIFKKFDFVFSGHYHHKSNKGNIYYLGTPYEIIAMDYADPKGFHIFDTETKELEFIRNPFTIFERIVYNSNNSYKDFDYSRLKNKFVKIIVENKTDLYQFEKFLENIDLVEPYDVKISETLNDIIADELDESINIEDTITILEHYIETAELTVDKQKLKTLMKELYIEAINL